MNRYPLWKYITVAIALVLGLVYTLPNFFGEAPAVQVSSAKATIKVDQKALARVEEALKAAGITADKQFLLTISVTEDEILGIGGENISGFYAAMKYFQSLDNQNNK